MPCLSRKCIRVEKIEIICVFNLLNYDIRENCYFERLVTANLLPPPQNCWISDTWTQPRKNKETSNAVIIQHDPVWSNLIQRDPIWSNLIQFNKGVYFFLWLYSCVWNPTILWRWQQLCFDETFKIAIFYVCLNSANWAIWWFLFFPLVYISEIKMALF